MQRHHHQVWSQRGIIEVSKEEEEILKEAQEEADKLPLEVKIVKEVEEEENEEPDYEDIEITDKEIEDYRG